MESSCLDEVDDTSILKTGRPCCYRPLSRSPWPQIEARLSQLSRSDLVHWRRRSADGDPTHALVAQQSQSIPDNLVALLGHRRAWNCSTQNARIRSSGGFAKY